MQCHTALAGITLYNTKLYRGVLHHIVLLSYYTVLCHMSMCNGPMHCTSNAIMKHHAISHEIIYEATTQYAALWCVGFGCIMTFRFLYDTALRRIILC